MSIQAVGTNDSATRKNRVNSLISNSVKISGYASLGPWNGKCCGWC